MEIKLKFSTGKEIELTHGEFFELFGRLAYQPVYQPVNPYNPYYPTYTTSDSTGFDMGNVYEKI
jgi:hypothetical protein